MGSWPAWCTKRNLELAAGCAGAVAVLLFPASLFTLGLGAVLGYRGKNWLDRLADSADPEILVHQISREREGV